MLGCGFSFASINNKNAVDHACAVGDLARIAKQGMRGAMIWGAPPAERPYSDRRYDLPCYNDHNDQTINW